MRAAGCVIALCLGGCVLTSTYEAEVARVRALEKSVASERAERTALERRLSDLSKERESLELTSSSLEQQRTELMERNEDLRVAGQQLEQRLEEERIAREQAAAQVQSLSGTYQSLVDELENEVQSGRIEIQRLQGRLQVRALDRILFASGSAEITQEGENVLTRVAKQILKLPDQSVRVEGHTDNVPISTALFPSNWELSAARAARVVRAFEAAGVPSDRLEAVGFGPNRPLESNDSGKGRSRNRRIEIVLVPVEG